ncbi:DUF2075 domain-containing protein [candidate division WWE3 bacterium]|nr:DUF2075 domain-containing protein [candidate division WWE3 bacterium]
MILYQGLVSEFTEIIENNQIIPTLEKEFKNKLGRKLPPNEFSAYTNSLSFIERIIRKSKVESNCGVLIEYIIPSTSNRIDFIITGLNQNKAENFIIIELKQWQQAEATELESLVTTMLGGKFKDTVHPSYQASSYKQFLNDFNPHISDGSVIANACAYLHNYRRSEYEPLLEPQYSHVVKDAPLFFQGDTDKLADYINGKVGLGNGAAIIDKIEHGPTKPSKKLISHVSKIIKGNKEFILLDDQKVAYEKALYFARKPEDKSVIIIKGGPGTGKSVIAVNLLAQLLKDQRNAIFVAPNASFREVLVKKLAQEHSLIRLKNLFKGSSGFVEIEPNTFDALIVDEAHRLKQKGAFMYHGDNQIEDIVRKSKTSVFFIDDDQIIRPDDVGSVSEIKKIAELYDAKVEEIELTAQFRCSGAEGYINWINDVLHIKETANFNGWDKSTFDFKIFDDPNELRQAILEKHNQGNYSRILAGYAWKWSLANEGNGNAEIEDIEIPEFDFKMPWNSRKVGSTWALDTDGIHQAGCIHTSQGLEFDYVGVIVGKDLTFSFDTYSYSTSVIEYKDVAGKKGLKDRPDELNKYVRNIYKTLMTRGIKGCYVYFMDVNVKNHFKNRLQNSH